MARGPRYLKLRHRTWSFQIDVPRDLRESFEGKPNFDGVKIVKTTGERDISLAQPVALRWASEYKKQFNRLRSSVGGSGAVPRDVYKSKLEALESGDFEVTFMVEGEPDDPHFDPEGEKASLEADLMLEAAARRKGNRGREGYPVSYS